MANTKGSDNPFPSVLFAEHVDPSNPAAGFQRLFVDTDHVLKMVDSSGTVTTFGTGFADPMTTRGDIIIRNASNVTARLGRGSAGTFLSSDGTDVSWATPSAGAASNLASAKYKRTSGDYTTTSNTFVDVDATNLSLTITTGARRVLVSFVGSGYNTNTGDYIGLDVDLDGTRMIGGNFGLFVKNVATSEPANLSFSLLSDVLSAASHTFKLQFRRSTAGTVTLLGTGNTALVFSVAELYSA